MDRVLERVDAARQPARPRGRDPVAQHAAVAGQGDADPARQLSPRRAARPDRRPVRPLPQRDDGRRRRPASSSFPRSSSCRTGACHRRRSTGRRRCAGATRPPRRSSAGCARTSTATRSTASTGSRAPGTASCTSRSSTSSRPPTCGSSSTSIGPCTRGSGTTHRSRRPSRSPRRLSMRTLADNRAVAMTASARRRADPPARPRPAGRAEAPAPPRQRAGRWLEPAGRGDHAPRCRSCGAG